MLTGALLGGVVLAGAAAFLILSYRLARIAGLASSSRLALAATGFGILGVAQLLSAASYYSADTRNAYMFYVGSASFSMAGYVMILMASASRRAVLYAVSPALLLPSSIDVVASLLACILAYMTGGVARLGFTVLALSHVMRAIPLLEGGLHLGPALSFLVLLGEVVRAVSASALALFYTKGALSHEAE